MKTQKKERVFILKNGRKPLSYTLASSGSKRRPLLAVVKNEEGYEESRPIRYSKVHSSPFINEQLGEPLLEPIVFIDGVLVANTVMDANMIKFLEITPDNGMLFVELDRDMEASEEVDMFQLRLEAMNFAKDADIEILEPIIADITGRSTKNMTSHEIKRDAYIYAERDPELLLSYRNNPEVQIRTVIRSAMEHKLLTLRNGESAWHKNFPDDKKKFLDVKGDDDAMETLEYWMANTKDGVELMLTLEGMIKELENN